ncbi:hypothetical protein [Pseudomonas sp. PD9R]|uniref:hypothetical protein n=1 Tax=Pseudomonas sp. PD9R TaxID=2853534 RepID=UPI001C44AAEB|nr:hypothetical protein [Pseudomonas sp. PD9R]MBV6825824.1 hypothetical protein [Pseudomonas sp. PD9R]
MTYPEQGFQTVIGRFLIDSLKATFYMACSGWRTPYPQKRQQTLGATSAYLWKTTSSRDKSSFAQGLSG